LLLASGAAGSPWEFHPHPEVWLLNAGLLIAYFAALRFWGPERAPAGRPPVETWRKACFVTGVIVLWLSADWPMHDISENHLFSAHMLQHLLYMFAVPPLLLLGLPAWLLRSLVGSGRRLRALRWVTRPVPALLISNGVIVFIHWPAIVDLQVTSEAGHLGIHALLLTGMLLMWWPVIPPLPETASLSQPAKMLYLFLQSFIPTVPASFLTFAAEPLYRIYEGKDLLWGLDAVTDQRISGLLMKIGGGLILWAVIAYMFFRWSSQESKTEGQEITWDDFERELQAWDMRK
jgi:putative membrane protein